MSLNAFILIIVAGLIHASWNIAAKKAGGDVRFVFFTSAMVVLVWAPLGLWLGWDEIPRWGALEWGVIVGSGVLHVMYHIVLLRGYRKADLTVVYPLARGSAPLLSSIVAITLLGEQISALGLLGIAGVVGGVFLIAGGPGLLRASYDPAARVRVRKGIAYGLLTGAFVAGYTVVDGYAVKMLFISPVLVDYVGTFLRTVWLAPVVWRDMPAAMAMWKAQWRFAFLVALVSPIAYVMALFAMREAPLSHVAPAREVSMLFAALIGGHLLREGDRVARICGAVCIAAGVTALALG